MHIIPTQLGLVISLSAETGAAEDATRKHEEITGMVVKCSMGKRVRKEGKAKMRHVVNTCMPP